MSMEHQAIARLRRRHRRLVCPTVLGVLAASLLVGVSPAGAGGTSAARRQQQLEGKLLELVDEAGFDQTIDYGPFEDVCPGAAFCAAPGPVKELPNIDLAVIELDEHGQAVRAANVLVSRDHPTGVIAPIDRGAGPAGSYGVSDVRWLRWDIDRFNGGTFDQTTGRQVSVKGWTDRPALSAADDVVAGRDAASLQFMSPYPASLFKLIVAFRIMRLVDAGQLRLTDQLRYDPPVALTPQRDERSEDDFHGQRAARATETTTPPTPTTSPTSPTPTTSPTIPAATGTAAAPPPPQKSIGEWMSAMMTYSDNDSAKALLKLLADRHDFPAMQAELAAMGLTTLQINGTNPQTGGNWQPGAITMTSMDTARLLWLIDAEEGELWTRPDGQRVSATMLSAGSRAFLKTLLDEQGYHEVLSTTNLCGAEHVSAGIPARLASRWINPDGTATVDGYAYGRDVRPCNERAEVTFGHKTGATYNYGSDAGIVRSLPGAPDRHYIISFISNLGYRYTDAAFADRKTYPCYDEVGPICYTQRIPALARRIDEYLAGGALSADATDILFGILSDDRRVGYGAAGEPDDGARGSGRR